MHFDDPFTLYRSVLFVALAAYYAITMGVAAWHVAVLLQGSDPRKRLLRAYLSYQAVSFRVRPLRSELLQILFWCTILALLWWLHPTP